MAQSLGASDIHLQILLRTVNKHEQKKNRQERPTDDRGTSEPQLVHAASTNYYKSGIKPPHIQPQQEGTPDRLGKLRTMPVLPFYLEMI